MKKEDIEDAISNFNKAIELDPEDVNAYVNRGTYYHTIRKHRKAIADYRKALKLKPDAAFVKRLRAYLHYDSASFLIDIVNYRSFVERTGTS